MNKEIKYHSPDGPAFQPGEQWIGVNGSRVTILSSTRWGEDKWDVQVTYLQCDGTTASKNANIFQSKYAHEADLVAVPRLARPKA